MVDKKGLLELAEKAKEMAYAPYSNFRVGAAVQMSSGKVYTGANIENASFGATNCAERTAIFKAVSEGEKTIEAIAIASDNPDFIFPCGICRQVMSEFSHKGTKVICSKKNGEYKEYTFDKLLPEPFIKFI